MAPPKAPPALNVPESKETVKVSCIDSTTYLKLPMEPFLVPVIKGKEFMTCPAFAFLIQHPSGKTVLFDLGTRKDWESLPPVLVKAFKEKEWVIEIQKNVAEILQESGVDVKNGAVDSVIWSHHHWDHIGDMSTLPKSTELVVGPGFLKEHLPGYPENENSTLPSSDFQDRQVREIDFSNDDDKGGEKNFKIGRFNAFDYFGDGSFYLLDTPGHSVGHICGLARTTASPPTFVFMGGDASHHGGEFRPSEYLPLPKNINPSPLKSMTLCPGHLLQGIHREKNPTKPYYLVTEAFAHDLKVCNWTIDGLQEFDAAENVFLLVAHDESVMDIVDFYPKDMNDWFEKDHARKSKWRFLADYEEAIKDLKK